MQVLKLRFAPVKQPQELTLKVSGTKAELDRIVAFIKSMKDKK